MLGHFCRSSENHRPEASIISANEEAKHDQMPAPKTGVLYKTNRANKVL